MLGVVEKRFVCAPAGGRAQVGTALGPRAVPGCMCLAARGHSCPQPLPNTDTARTCCPFPLNTLLRTGMSARRAKRTPPARSGHGRPTAIGEIGRAHV